MQQKYLRWQTKNIKEALSSRRIIVLSGARQCGKTTLAKTLNFKDSIYYTLDDVALLESAKNDPHGFVMHGDQLMIIDEVQKAPTLLPAAKKDVDENQKLGRFLITGSANIQALPGVNESLAGRIRKIRLRPLAQGEIERKKPNFLQKAFKQKFSSSYPEYTKDVCLNLALRGGYPEPLLINKEKIDYQWHLDYVDALLERDLKDVANIKRKDKMKSLIHALSAWSSKLMDIASISSGLSLSRQTISTYINALETLYLIDRLPPWSKTDYSRINKNDKIFMSDTGLMAAILNWKYEKVRFDGEKNGKLLETYVLAQLFAHIEASDIKYSIYYYRDREKREIDFIIEDEDNCLLGIEVKAGSAVSRDSFKHLYWFKDNISNNQPFIGIVLYTGNQLAAFGKDMWAVPISSLWE